LKTIFDSLSKRISLAKPVARIKNIASKKNNFLFIFHSMIYCPGKPLIGF